MANSRSQSSGPEVHLSITAAAAPANCACRRSPPSALWRRSCMLPTQVGRSAELGIGWVRSYSSRRASGAHPSPQKHAAATLTKAFVAPTARPALCSRGQGGDGRGAAHLQRHAGAAGGGGGGARTVSTLAVPIQAGSTCHGGAEVGARMARANFNSASWRSSGSLVRGMHACAAWGLGWPQQARKPKHLCPASPGSCSPANPCDQICTNLLPSPPATFHICAAHQPHCHWRPSALAARGWLPPRFLPSNF